MKLIRKSLGSLIVFFNWLFKPKQIKRTHDQQNQINEQVKGLSLYQFHGCPFCVKVRRQIHRLNLPISLRDVNQHQHYRTELLNQGGKVKVPCLRIEKDNNVQWLYESSDINQFLEKQFR
ncbi:glutaredoxin [Candidatus Marinamargulisbacteria bacterium SCGC AG-410-N11]|nr:glutaredoxin [Candidatus Marinamargulisbacteria bacterium SCGC AG-410-N11]